MTVHSFARKAAQSRAPEVISRTEEILRAKIEARKFRWTDEGGADDHAGVDVFAILPNRKNVGIDVKDNQWGEVRLEYVSRVGEGVAGWTIDDTKQTDYVLNLWPKTFWLIDFPSLKAVAKERREDYVRWYGPKVSHSESENASTWETNFVPVPVGRLLHDIYGRSAPVGVELTRVRLCPVCREEHAVGLTCAETGL